MWVEAHASLPRKELHLAFLMQFDREVSADQLVDLRKRKGWRTGRDGRWSKGCAPSNKGKIGLGSHPNCRAAQFRKGNTPPLVKPIGHERVDKGGYVLINVEEVNPHTGYGRRYVRKHKLLWEKTNGPLREGYVLKCLDGNRSNTDPSNWVDVPHGARLAINRRGFDKASPEIKPLILSVSMVEHAIRKRSV